jgi:hypothetical protein
MAHHKVVKPAAVASDAIGGLLEIECFAGGLDFQNATNIIALQSKKMARRFGLTDAAAKALVPLVYGESTR